MSQTHQLAMDTIPPQPGRDRGRREERLTALAYEYYVGGANDEVTVRENRSAFERPRPLSRARRRQPSFDEDDGPRSAGRLPVLVAPTAFQRLACDEGEIATRGGQVGGHGDDPQHGLHVRDRGRRRGWRTPMVPAVRLLDRGLTQALIERAEACGWELSCSPSMPVLGRRERDLRNRFHLPDGCAWQTCPRQVVFPCPPGMAIGAGEPFRERHRRRPHVARRGVASLDHSAPRADQGDRAWRRRGEGDRSRRVSDYRVEPRRPSARHRDRVRPRASRGR